MKMIFTRRESSVDSWKKDKWGGPAVSPDSDQTSMSAANPLFFSETQRISLVVTNYSNTLLAKAIQAVE